MNRGMKSKDVVGSSTQKGAESSSLHPFPTAGSPGTSLPLVKCRGCSEMAYKLSSPPWLLCSALNCRGSGIPRTREIT